MEADIMGRVFRPADARLLDSPRGIFRRLLAETDYLSLYLLDAQPSTGSEEPVHSEEHIVFLLQGQMRYTDGRLAKTGDTVVNLPDHPYRWVVPGGGTLRALEIAARPGPGTAHADSSLMARVVRLADLTRKVRPLTGSTRRVLVMGGSVCMSLIENMPPRELPELGHPEEEIIYMLQGELVYDDGRHAKRGEAVCNLPNRAHSGRYVGTEPVRLLVIQSPPNSSW